MKAKNDTWQRGEYEWTDPAALWIPDDQKRLPDYGWFRRLEADTMLMLYEQAGQCPHRYPRMVPGCRVNAASMQGIYRVLQWLAEQLDVEIAPMPELIDGKTMATRQLLNLYITALQTCANAMQR